MPQLDITTLFSQIFWLIVTFVRFYVLITQRYLTPAVALLKVRQNYSTDKDEIGETKTIKPTKIFTDTRKLRQQSYKTQNKEKNQQTIYAKNKLPSEIVEVNQSLKLQLRIEALKK